MCTPTTVPFWLRRATPVPLPSNLCFFSRQGQANNHGIHGKRRHDHCCNSGAPYDAHMRASAACLYESYESGHGICWLTISASKRGTRQQERSGSNDGDRTATNRHGEQVAIADSGHRDDRELRRREQHDTTSKHDAAAASAELRSDGRTQRRAHRRHGERVAAQLRTRMLPQVSESMGWPAELIVPHRQAKGQRWPWVADSLSGTGGGAHPDGILV